MKAKTITAFIASSLLASSLAFADTPQGLERTDQGTHAGHSVEVKGKVTLFRIQEPGMNIGTGTDKLDADVLVTIDSQPDKVFGIKLEKDSAANREMVETLRQAYMNDVPITLQHRLSPGKKNVSISWVELTRE